MNKTDKVLLKLTKRERKPKLIQRDEKQIFIPNSNENQKVIRECFENVYSKRQEDRRNESICKGLQCTTVQSVGCKHVNNVNRPLTSTRLEQ